MTRSEIHDLIMIKRRGGVMKIYHIQFLSLIQVKSFPDLPLVLNVCFKAECMTIKCLSKIRLFEYMKQYFKSTHETFISV